MSFDAAPGRMLSPDAMNRRLATGVVISLLLHGFVLSLQFGIPGLPLAGRPAPINVTLAPAAPPQPQPADIVAEPLPLPSSPETVRRAATGLALVDPAPQPVPPPAPNREAIVRKDKPRRERRISTPVPVPAPDAATRVIAQADSPASEFVVPLPQPKAAEQKAIDPAEARHGADDVPEPAPEPEILASVEPDKKELEQRLANEERIAAEVREQERAAALALAARQEQQAQERLAAEARKQEELLAGQRRRDEALAEERRVRELLERQKAEEQLAQQLAERRKAEELVAQQRHMQELAERQRLEELAARRLAEEGARQQAARERELAQAAPVPAPAGDPFGAADGQGGDSRTRAPAAAYGSNLANRVREMSKGLDLLSGAPPARPRIDDNRSRRRVVADSSQRDVPLRMYVESIRQKLERNGALNFPKLIGDVRIDPLVSVSVRSDGSIEDVTIVRSSGRADTDEAVHRIVRINARYSAFPPAIAARYDVIEIRRIWTFDQVLKLVEEIR
ncbi:TonB C-terminal domain-containing protein [Massilia cavernae]|uniref:TonB family protein n=1 Tax=Massilia cavernae TaxID=2320864 RepID=A0A418XAJ8_9BURK|nr:TonB C-terminal domain-containing protein [Massilia cavernae]RJG09481.1 hypothetical protein D3872_22635 [Massilia cavernae]